MDFLKIVKSLEDLLYELMAWVVFYPRTLWRVLVHPAGMMHYADHELADAVTDQYTDTISPPLFLMLSVVIAHGVELGLGEKSPVSSTGIGKAFIDSEQNLLIFRSILFSLFALVCATTALRRRGLGLDRKTLRRPFFSQCYLTAPFALAISLAATLHNTRTLSAAPAGLAWTPGALALAGVAWYLWVQTTWFRREVAVSASAAFALAAWCFTRSLAYSLVIGLLMSNGWPPPGACWNG